MSYITLYFANSRPLLVLIPGSRDSIVPSCTEALRPIKEIILFVRYNLYDACYCTFVTFLFVCLFVLCLTHPFPGIQQMMVRLTCAISSMSFVSATLDTLSHTDKSHNLTGSYSRELWYS